MNSLDIYDCLIIHIIKKKSLHTLVLNHLTLLYVLCLIDILSSYGRIDTMSYQLRTRYQPTIQIEYSICKLIYR